MTMTGLALNHLDRREGLVLVQAVTGNAALPNEIMRCSGVPTACRCLPKS
jgi:hypothetical protein